MSSKGRSSTGGSSEERLLGEGPHRSGSSSAWSETWEFRAATDDRALAVAVAFVRRPAEGRVSYRAVLLGRNRPPVVVVDHDLAPPRVGLEVRGPGIWADHICEEAHSHWTLGLESFALALSGPDDMLDQERGDLVAFGFDLGWEADQAPVPLAGASSGDPAKRSARRSESGDSDRGYHTTGTMHGEILLADERIEFVGSAARIHRWGTGPALLPWWSLGDEAGFGTPPWAATFDIDARVSVRDSMGRVSDLAVGVVVDSAGVHGPSWCSVLSA